MWEVFLDKLHAGFAMAGWRLENVDSSSGIVVGGEGFG